MIIPETLKEREIEELYYKCFREVDQRITCKKEKLGIGTTDGIIRFHDDNNKLLFWILQETKRNVGIDSVWFGRSLLQSLMYLGNVFYDTNVLGVDTFKGIFLNSARYFCFIPKEEIIPVMERFEPLWNKYYRVRPSEAYNIPELSDIIPELLKTMNIQKYSVNNLRLDLIIKDIYENHNK